MGAETVQIFCVASWPDKRETLAINEIKSKLEIEVIAKLALQAKCDDFFIGLIGSKSTIPWWRRRFAADQTNEKSADLACKASFAMTSIV
jgi:hypothetical protein